MKIMHLLAPADAGGLERVVHALAIGQQRAGHEVVAVPVAEHWSNQHSFVAPLARANVTVRPVVLPGRAYLRERAQIASILGELRPDVVHSHGYHTDVIDTGVARGHGIATVSTAHGFTRGSWKNLIYEYLDRRAFGRMDAVAAVSRLLADEIIASGVPSDRVHVVPNAWSRIATPLPRAAARRELGLPDDGLVVGWVGRMSYEKGLDVMIDALGLVADLPITAVLIGDGPERATQEARTDTMRLSSPVRWPGMVREAGRMFNALDLLILSSRTEGVPMVVLEAMAANVPLIATAVGGIPDVVSPREALLVPSQQPTAIAAAIRTVCGDQASAAVRAAAARARLDAQFAEGPWLAHYDRIYGMARDRAAHRLDGSGGRGETFPVANRQT